MTEPMIDARAMSSRPALIARMTITTSGRLPNVAFRRADTRRAGGVPGLVGRLAEEPGERHQRDRRGGEDELAPHVAQPQPDGDRGQRDHDGEPCPVARAHRYQKDAATIA